MDDYMTINGVLYKRVDEKSMDHGEFHLHSFEGQKPNCQWQIQNAGKSWRCQHGVEVTKHPNGYCNGGCCR